MASQRDALELLRQAAVRALDESWDIHLPSTLLERAWVNELRTLRTSLRGKWTDLGLDVLLRGTLRVQGRGPSDALIFGMSVDAFMVAIGATSAEDVASAAASLLDRSRYRRPVLVGPATHAGIDVVRAAHGLLGQFLETDAFARIKELTASSEAFEWDVRDGSAQNSDPVAVGEARRSIIDRLPLFQGLRPRRPVAVVTGNQLQPGPNVNVAILASSGPPEHLPRVAPGSNIWLAVGVWPHAGDGLSVPVHPLTLPTRIRRELVDVVVLPDPAKGRPVNALPSGQLRVSADGPFGVTRPAGVGPIGSADSRRLYFALQAPFAAGEWRVRCVLAVRGVVVHVEQVTVVVGESGENETSAHTTFRLVDDLSVPEALAGLGQPSLALYASDDEGTQGLSFLLPSNDGVDAAQVNLDPERVTTLVESARRTLAIAEGGPDEPGASALHPLTGLDDPEDVARLLVTLARTGRLLWEQVATAFDRSSTFAHNLQKAMREPGSVQLAIKHDTSHVVPLSLLYDFPLSATLEGMRVCDATKEWLQAQVGTPHGADLRGAVDEPLCIAGTCPQEGDASRVCVAGFWGYRHQMSSNLASDAPPLSVHVDATTGGRSRLTVATRVSPEHETSECWRAHEEALSRSVDVVRRMATFSSDGRMQFSADIDYLLTRVDYDAPDPYLEIDTRQGIDESAPQDPEALRSSSPLVVLNAYESAGASPGRVLQLVDRFFVHGASGVVSAETAVPLGLAVKFGEAFVARYAAGDSLGEAMRRSRIAMLALGSPLGLAYVSFGQFNLNVSVDPALQTE